MMQVKAWMGKDKGSRPSGYMNSPKFFSGYAAYHLPQHLPELYWVLEQLRPYYAQKLSKDLRVVKDLGCGPGTLSLSLALWLMNNTKTPKGQPLPDFHLVDFSKRATQGAEQLLRALDPKIHVSRYDENLLHHRTKNSQVKADLLLAGHVLNELGNGPRYREKKIALLHRWLHHELEVGGLLILIDPPLREPTMDLMWIRDYLLQNQIGASEDPDEQDDLFPNIRIVAPCPQGTQFCPMSRAKMGWCYAQPTRDWARDLGLADWDEEIEDTVDMRLSQMSFSYLVIEKIAPNKPLIEIEKHKIAVTDGRTFKNRLCNGKGIVPGGTIPFRGHYIKKNNSTKTE